MIGVLKTKLRLFYRNIWIFVLLVIGSIAFAFIIGSGNLGKINVPVFLGDETFEHAPIVSELETNDLYTFQVMSEKEAKQSLRSGSSELIIELNREYYNVFVNVDSQHVQIIDQLLSDLYLNEMKYSYLAKKLNINKEKVVKTLQQQEIFKIETEKAQKDVSLNMIYHPLFGFTLFFVIYTIAYNVFYILIERIDGMWNRIMLSPVKRWEVYTANLLYSFVIGYVQLIIVFSIFYYVFNFDFNGNFTKILLFSIPYIFTIVSLMILLTSIVKTTQQFNAVTPLIAVSMAMLGGAYWPLEVVENKAMLVLAKFMPVTYGMDILNGLTLYDKSTSELLLPVSILLFMSVLFAGVGIHIMERRYI